MFRKLSKRFNKKWYGVHGAGPNWMIKAFISVYFPGNKVYSN